MNWNRIGASIMIAACLVTFIQGHVSLALLFLIMAGVNLIIADLAEIKAKLGIKP